MTTAASSILIVDMVGSSMPRARLGQDEADQFSRRLVAVLAGIVRNHGGRVVSPAGDGIMAAFNSATDAVRAAMALQQTGGGQRDPVALRVGIATGDVTWEDGDCSGLPVLTAARLEGAADAGQVLVTNAVRLLAEGRCAATFEPLGPLALKGLPEPIDAFVVPWGFATGDGPGPGPGLQVRWPAAIASVALFDFVGRAAESAELAQAWTAVCRGEPRTVLIGGEAGAGKTRLAFEFAREVHAQGAHVLLGQCDTELAMPYQPWVQVLDQIVRALPNDLRDTLVDELSEVSVLVPQLERLLPVATRQRSIDPEAERYRLFNAMERLLVAVAERGPTIVVIDDLHWASPQTLALLRHLARSTVPSALLIVGTFRDTGDEITKPLAGCLADLRRTAATRRLRLEGLDGAAVEHFVAAAVGHELDRDLRALAALLADHSGGNAFYVGELWQHMTTTGVVQRLDDRWVARPVTGPGVPDSVREVVAGRVTRLSPAAQRVLQVAATAGQRVELRVLHAAVELPAADLGAGVDELLEAKLLVEVGGVLPTFQFAHAIVRDTVARLVSPTVRADLHLRIARAFEAVYEADRRPVLAQLAHHFTNAAASGAAPKALHYLQQAAVQALRSAAYDEAIGHLEVALQLEPGPTERVEVLLQLGEARAHHGQAGTAESRGHSAAHEAAANLVEAFGIARATGSANQAARAAVLYDGLLQAYGGLGESSLAMVSEARTLLGARPSPLHIRLQSSMARALALSGQLAEAHRLGDDALAAARSQNDPEVLVIALQCVMIYVEDPATLVRHANELTDLAGELGDSWSVAYASCNCARGHLALGQMNEARDAFNLFHRTAHQRRLVLFQYMAMSFEVMFAVAEGRLAEAEQLAGQAHRLGSSANTAFDAGVYGVQLFVIRRAQGRLAEVLPVLRLAATLQSDQRVWRPGLAVLFAETGMIEEARQEFEAIARQGYDSIPRDAVWQATLTFLAEVCTTLGDATRAEPLYRALEPFQGRTMMVGFTVCLGPAERMMGCLSALLGDRTRAEAHFAAALALAERSSAPVWQAQVQHDWAVALGDRPDLLAASRCTAERLGMHALVEQCDRYAATTATPEATVRISAPPRNGLSAREVQVLRLVARGLSNREIGQQLFISQNTAANHVRSILQKTSSANRAEATAFAGRNGLLGY